MQCKIHVNVQVSGSGSIMFAIYYECRKRFALLFVNQLLLDFRMICKSSWATKSYRLNTHLTFVSAIEVESMQIFGFTHSTTSAIEMCFVYICITFGNIFSCLDSCYFLDTSRNAQKSRKAEHFQLPLSLNFKRLFSYFCFDFCRENCQCDATNCRQRHAKNKCFNETLRAATCSSLAAALVAFEERTRASCSMWKQRHLNEGDNEIKLRNVSHV